MLAADFLIPDAHGDLLIKEYCIAFSTQRLTQEPKARGVSFTWGKASNAESSGPVQRPPPRVLWFHGPKQPAGVH